MLIDTNNALYVLAVAAAIPNLPPEALTDQCPECGSVQTFMQHDYHLVVRMPDTDPEVRKVAVVVGCEGYWVVNPALVGIDRPNWTPAPPPQPADDPPPPGSGACAQCMVWESRPDVHTACPQCGRPWDAIVPADPEDPCQHDHLYSVQCNAPASGLYVGPDLAAAIAAVRQSDPACDGLVWLSAEHIGSRWCQKETRAASAAAGLPDDYAEPDRT
jgi:rRNA maturation protein Nop10